MIGKILIDTGPLVAVLDADSQYHDWALQIWENSVAPALTCEAVITEATFLFQRDGIRVDPLFRLLSNGALKIGMAATDSIEDIHALMKRYGDAPMSFADACMVRLSEKNPHHRVVTFDSHFNYYRRHGNKVIPTLSPERRK